MQLTTKLPKRRRARPSSRSARPEPKQPQQPAPEASESRRAARRGGGPEDHALYSCVCGYAFTAEVTTSVGCPQCGTEQAW